MRFEHSFIDKVRDANNIVDLISEHTQLKRAGARFTGLCPFPDHNEKTPSFSVSEEKQVYYCFGCKKSGNIYTFAQALKGLSFPEAVEYLAARASIPIPKEAYEKGAIKGEVFSGREKKKSLWKANNYALGFFRQQLEKLPKDHPVKLYCQKRRLTAELIEKFEIGYAPEDWEGLTGFFNKSRVPLELAEDLGLVRRRKGGKSGHFDLFRERLMFPIVSTSGNCVGFGGRALAQDAHPKYINSPESEVFHKGKIFYGLNETAKYIRTEDQIIVVEGYMDLLALYGAGIKNVVATLGTALTRDHAKALQRFTKNVIVMFDGDAAGLEAAERSLPVLLESGLLPRHALIPGKQDPDDFINENGVEALKELVAEAPELFFSRLGHLMANYHGSNAEKVSVMDRMAPVLAITADRRLAELYCDDLADRLQVGADWVKRAVKQELQRQRASSSAEFTQTQQQGVKPKRAPSAGGGAGNLSANSLSDASQRQPGPPKAEFYLLNLALVQEKYLKEIAESGVVELFSDQRLKKIFDMAWHEYRQMPSEFDKLTALLVDRVENPDLIFQHLDKTWSELGEDGANKMVADCSRKVREVFLKAQAKEKLATLKGQSSSKQMEQLEQFMNIHSDRKNLQKENDI